MGKHLWRKHSYIRVENEDSGCIWALLRVLNYRRWHNVKRALPYNKQKPQEKNKGKPKQQHQIYISEELEEEAIKMNSASVNSSNYEASLALTAEEENFKKLDSLPEQTELQGLEDNSTDVKAPTLISLLEANRKLISSANGIDKSSSNVKVENNVEPKKASKEDQVGVLEIFRVNQDLFLKVLQDNPRKKPRLVKSGTFPAPNPIHTLTFGRTPSKVEHKHSEIWPVINNGHELRRAKSQRIGRSSSLNESVDRYDHLFDATGTGKEIKRHRSKSFRMTNEKEFGRRSFRERLSSLEIESYSFNLSEEPQASLERLDHRIQGEVRGLRLDSPRDFGSPTQIERLAVSHLNGKRNNVGVESGQNNHQEEEQFAQMTTASSHETNDEAHFPEDEVKTAECLIPKDSSLGSLDTSTFGNVDDNQVSNDHLIPLEKDIDYCNEDLQYVKYVLDVIGMTAGDDQLGAWHSVDQPLDPALFDGIEVCCPFEPNFSSKEAKAKVMSTSHRKVLFDLVNEALLYIHERSYVYYPKPLSFSCHVRPMPKGKSLVVEEVWEFISECLSWRPELDQTLDCAVANDLSKSGWTNLQMDSEYIALYVEDLIFDELLGEIICC